VGGIGRREGGGVLGVIENYIKGTVSVVSSDRPCKDGSLEITLTVQLKLKNIFSQTE